jgi:hypothetical protein
MIKPQESTTAGAILQTEGAREYKPDDIRDAAIAEFIQLASNKFDAGQKEHDGRRDKCNLVQRVNLAQAKEEVVDLWFYLSALELKYGEK